MSTLLLLFSPGLAALQKSIHFDRLSVEDGLSHELVTSIAQDQQGFMWFATVVGLNRYDGYQFVTYMHDPDDPDSISDNEVRYIIVDSQGVLWAATSAGLNRFNRESETFTRFRHVPDDPDSLSSDQLATIYEDSTGTIWVGTFGSGLEKFDRNSGTFTHFPHDPDDPSSLSSGVVRRIYEDGENVMWVGTYSMDGKADLHRFDRDTVTFSRFFSCDTEQVSCPQPSTDVDRPPRPMVSGLFEDSNGALWIGGYGVTRYDSTSNTYQTFYNSEDPDSISGNNPSGNIIEDQNGLLWFGDTFSGLNSYNPITGVFDTYRHNPSDPTSISSDGIFTLYKGSSGLIWIATYTGGVNRFDPQSLAFGSYKHNPNDLRGLSSGVMNALAEDHDGRLWVGGRGQWLNRVDRKNGSIDRYEHDPDNPDSLTDTIINDLFVDKNNTLWIGTGRDLSRFDAETETFVSYPVGPDEANPDIGVRSIAEDENGYLWLGTDRTLTRFEPASGELVHYQTNSGLPDSLQGQRFNVFNAEDGKLWVTSIDAGFHLFDPTTERFTNYQHDPNNPNSLSQGYTRIVFPGPNGMLWVAVNNVLDRFDPDSGLFTHYTSKDGLPNTAVMWITPDREGNLWICTSAGISRLNPETMAITNFNMNDGLVGLEMGQGWLLDSGELVFMANRGINIFDPANLPESSDGLKLVLTDFLIFNQSVSVGGPDSVSPLTTTISEASEIKLNHNDYLFSFEFSSLAYANQSDVRYEYLLDGFDNDWIATDSSKRFATYTNVPPGEYLLRVRASTNNNQWIDIAHPVTLKILPPLWQTWWAYTLYFLMFLMLLTSFIQWRTRLLRIRSRELKSAVDERTERLIKSEVTVRRQADSLQELLGLKERLFTNISHEFRTPLTLMLGPIDNAMKEAERPEIVAQLDMARRNGKRVLRLVDQLLELSRLSSEEPLVMSPQPLQPLVEVVSEAFRPYAREKGITLSVMTDENLWVNCAEDAIERILMNLLSNSLKFTNRGGRVNVILREYEGGTQDNGNEIELAVFDTGKGIAHDMQQAIFERFKRADEFGEAMPGSGIGLALVKELTNAHDGEVKLKSEPGKGTVVTILLPRYQVKAGVQRKSNLVSSEALKLEIETLEQPKPFLPDDSDGKDSGKPQLLIIEDNRDMQAYLYQMLSSDYDVELTGDGEAGLAFALEQIPDIIICDVMLPKKDGYQVSHELKADDRTSHIPIIMLTARSDEDSKLEGLREHVNDFLTKPFNDEELIIRIANLLAVRDILKARYSGQLHAGGDPRSELKESERLFMERLELALEKNHADLDFTVTQMAAGMAMSVRQLQRKLKALTDQQPGHYLRLHRLNQSLTLLQMGKRIGDVAYSVGFGSPAHFASCFRAQYGCTPTEYQGRHTGVGTAS